MRRLLGISVKINKQADMAAALNELEVVASLVSQDDEFCDLRSFKSPPLPFLTRAKHPS